MSSAGLFVVAAAMVIGLIGTVVPVMPGLLLIWGAGLVYGVLAGFGGVGIAAFAVMTILLGLGLATGYVLPKRAGVRSGAPKSSIRLGVLGAVIGFS